MRSPIIAISIMAAAVSPTLVAASSPQGSSITHPRVTEVETKNPSNAFQFLKRQLSASKLGQLQRFSGFTDPLGVLESLGGGAAGAANGDAPSGSDPLPSVPTQDLPTQDLPPPVQSAAQPVESTAGTAVGESPAGQVAEPADPYQGGHVDSTSSSKNSKNGKQKSRVPKQSKAEIEQMAEEE